MPDQDGRDLLDLVHDSVILRALDGRILAWNRAAEELYGWPRAAAIGQPVHELLHTDHPDTPAILDERLQDAGSWQGELARRHASGRQVLVESRWTLRPGIGDTPAQVVETGRDVTASRRAEEALRHSEHRYHNLFQAMAAAFWELDFFPVGDMLRRLRSEGVGDFAAHFAAHPQFVREMMRATRVLDVNEQAVSLFGRGDKAELLGNIEPFWPEASGPVFAASVIAAIGREPHYAAETRLRTLEGREFDALFTACFPPKTMNKGSLLIGVIDIDDRKRAERALRRSEARYRSMFHGAAVSFWEVDFSGPQAVLDRLRRDGTARFDAALRAEPGLVDRLLSLSLVVDVNDRTLRMFGAESREALLGPIGRFVPPASRAAVGQAFAASFQGRPLFETETRLRTLDGRDIDVLLTASAPPESRDAGTVLIGLVDISERVAARSDLARLQAELAHAARVSMLGELTASIAHEVNQPLAAIAASGAAGLRWLDRPQPDLAEVQALTERMVADAQRAAGIIARIRRMALPTAAPERLPVSLNEVVQEAMLFLGHELARQQVAVRMDLADDLPAISADRTQLQQVVVNLAVNALQAMAEAGQRQPRLDLRTAQQEGRLMLVVIDNGPGLPDGRADRLFENFFTTKAGGMGMGLAICRSILAAHGGRIDACSAPEGGACMTVTLPLD